MFRVSQFYKNSRLFAIFVVILAAVSFVGAGALQYTSDDQSQTVIKVGDQSISFEQFDQTFRRFQQLYQDQNISTKRLYNLVANHMLNLYGRIDYAKQLGVKISDQVILNYVRNQFSQDGDFSLKAYQSFLSSNFYTDVAYEQDVNNSFLSAIATRHDKRLLNGLLGSNELQSISQAYFAKRQVDVLSVNVADFFEKKLVNSEKAKAYYQANQDLFVEPEKVAIDYIQFDFQANKDQFEPSKEQVTQYYKTNQASMFEPEQRLFWDVKFDKNADPSINQKNAELFYNLIHRQRADIKSLLKQQFSKNATFSPSTQWAKKGELPFLLEEALYSMTPGDAQIVTDEENSIHVLQLAEVKPKKILTFDEVEKDLQYLLRQKNWNHYMASIVDQIESNDSLNSVAQKYQKIIQKSELFSRHIGIGGDISQINEVREAAFKNDALVDTIAPILVEDGKKLFLFTKDQVQKTRQYTFEEVQDEVNNIVLQEQALANAKLKADQFVKELNNQTIKRYQQFAQKNKALVELGWVDESTYRLLENNSSSNISQHLDAQMLDQIKLQTPPKLGQVSTKLLISAKGEYVVSILKAVEYKDELDPKDEQKFNQRIQAIYQDYFYHVWLSALSNEMDIQVNLTQTNH